MWIRKSQNDFNGRIKKNSRPIVKPSCFAKGLQQTLTALYTPDQENIYEHDFNKPNHLLILPSFPS